MYIWIISHSIAPSDEGFIGWDNQRIIYISAANKIPPSIRPTLDRGEQVIMHILVDSNSWNIHTGNPTQASWLTEGKEFLLTPVLVETSEHGWNLELDGNEFKLWFYKHRCWHRQFCGSSGLGKAQPCAELNPSFPDTAKPKAKQHEFCDSPNMPVHQER